jgi:hypothetical protein
MKIRPLLRLVAVSLLIIALPLRARADPMTQRQIVDLHSAGIGDATIARQVDVSGISFNADAAALLELKKAGLSDIVLDAVIRRAGSAAPRAADASAADSVSNLYRAKKYPEVADRLTVKFKNNTATDRDGAILVLALLKLGLPVIEWVKIDHFSIKASAACRSGPSSEGIPHRATRTIGAG